jgi:uncharacterized membrane protein YphA (DoxX/SURF4 family)
VLADTSIKNTYVPLLLRLSLGVIILWHGLLKVGGDQNDWGAAWASNKWQAAGKAPKDLLAKLDRVQADSQTIAKSKDLVNEAFAKEPSRIPDSLHWSVAQLAVAWGEVAAGVALLLGLLTRWAAAGLVIIQAGAIATITGVKGFALGAGEAGYDYNVALLAMCVCLILLGGGTLSLDRWRASRRKTAPGVPAPQAPPATPVSV